jgi:hypothetical protein
MSDLHALESLLLPPPLPAVVSVLVVVGTWRFAERVRRWFLPAAEAPLERAATFCATVAVICSLVQAVAWAGLAMHTVLRVLGAALIANAVLGPWRGIPASVKGFFVRKRSRVARWSGFLALFCAVGLVLAALGPPTDEDSMRYHLAVPLRWWIEGHAVPQLESLHARLVGPGESLVLLGLALGTDNLSAAFQATALLVWLAVLVSLGHRDENRAVAVLMAVGCPLMLFLVPNQKPQLLPAVSLAVAFALLINFGDRRRLWLASGCGLFAVSCKLSFALDAAALFGVALWWLVPRSGGRRRDLVLAGSVLSLFLLLPQLARNFAFYGDPLTPVLERFRAVPDPAVVAFATHLRRFGAVTDWRQNPLLAVGMVVPLSIGTVPKALGMGSLAWLWLLPCAPGAALVAAGLAAALTLVAGQVAGRFLLSPYLWLSALIASAGPGRSLGAFRRLMVGQALLVAPLCLAGGLELFPGALIRPWRTAVMEDAGFDYGTAEFCRQSLQLGDRLLVEQRGNAYFPLPYLAVESFSELRGSAMWQAARTWLAADSRSTYLLTQAEFASPMRSLLAPCVEEPAVAVYQGRVATRNPFNRRPGTVVGIYRLNLSRPECRSLLLASDAPSRFKTPRAIMKNRE